MKNSVLINISRKIFHHLKRNFPILNKWQLKYHISIGTVAPISNLNDYLNAADEILISPISKEIRVGLVKKEEDIEFKDFFLKRADWPKYVRFLKNNNIYYSFYDVHKSTWQKDAAKFDIIIWSIESPPYSQLEAKNKIYFLENYMGIKCFPSYDQIWSYEDKINAYYLYNHFGFPVVKTFISHSKVDSLEFLNNTSFPIVSKITTGSSSMGVIKLNNKKEALKYIFSTFSDKGRKTYWPYIRQKNYVYFQQYIEDAMFDLRIIVVANKVFGYYRYAKKGDFRASGAGIVEKKSLPEQAMRIAINAKMLLKSTRLAVDMLYSEKEQKYYIIETSIFFGIDTAEQLMIDGKPGYYEYQNDEFIFKEGKFWIQELALQDFFNSQMK